MLKSRKVKGHFEMPNIGEMHLILLHYLHNLIKHLFCPPKIFLNHCLQVLLGHEDVLREIKNNAYANFWGGGG